MKHWHAKAFSKLAKVSVRTLHHYDRLGLLKPSLRQSNNYRVYSEKDLLTLQQIIALKFFGFELAQIKPLLTREDTVFESLIMQAELLQKKAQALLEARAIITRITSSCSDKESIPWQQIIELIEVFHMTQQLEDAWVNDIFTAEELRQYAEFEAKMKAGSTPEQRAAFEQGWFTLVDEVKSNLHHSPDSAVGIALGKKWMDWVNNLYGKQYAHLRTKKFEKGFGEGKGLLEHGLTPELIAWMEKAVDAYWRQRLHQVLSQAGQAPSSQVLRLWNELMEEMYGDEEKRKADIPALALQEQGLSHEAKAWLKKTFNQ
ncbi:MerR family transcriptional regulator [Legionella taurinensis]|uniref:MerR family transcriptional regulator n=1 Tax=Legionella taurinensis TaxID=70611 RepID=A0A3A5L2M6_9GAMM|nr:MerR family transcriptional regulator [Legionella taurinensis]RJT45539.1 MerR family transcriptional regulator [Legionella taurinensis]RJT66155.1 MerR family transcriptional regulator [Legionella taurinensis]STY26323.1 MerR family transcriptional regulator [Legionella taurinensis]